MGKRFVRFIKRGFFCIFEVIYPYEDNCIACGNELEWEKWICTSCMKKVRYCQDDFTVKVDNTEFKCYSLAYYSGIIKELVLRLKYKNDFNCREALSHLMVDIIRQKGISVDLITFVPCTPLTLKKRGYNQSRELAASIGRHLNLQVKECLEKVRETKDQIGLNAEMRWENLKESYRLKKNIKLNNKSILLVDDVFTTGATVSYCVRELKIGKVDNVIILTAAKSKL